MSNVVIELAQYFTGPAVSAHSMGLGAGGTPKIVAEEFFKAPEFFDRKGRWISDRRCSMTTPQEVGMTKLLPCPFCGGQPVRCFNVQRADSPMYWVLCRDCHACPGDRRTDAEADIAWNTRKGQTP